MKSIFCNALVLLFLWRMKRSSDFPVCSTFHWIFREIFSGVVDGLCPTYKGVVQGSAGGFFVIFGLVDNRVCFFQPDPFSGYEQIHFLGSFVEIQVSAVVRKFD